MNIPVSVKVGALIYQVRQESGLFGRHSKFGQHDFFRQEILLDADLPDRAKQSSLVHEIIEAINYNYELGLEHNKITTLETALYQILSDNKLF